jgi:hypothetical protein
MSVLQASPLHLISGLINAPLFHRELSETPPEVTIQGVRLLARLADNEEFAYQANQEMVQFLSQSTPSLDDETYVLVVSHFITQLQTQLHTSDPIWGAVAVVMASVAKRFSVGQDREVWTRLCGLFFQVLRVKGIISEEQVKRFLTSAEEPMELSAAPSQEQPKARSQAQAQAQAEQEAEDTRQRDAALSLLGGADYAFERRLKKG